MKIGFTGTQDGMTAAQAETLGALLRIRDAGLIDRLERRGALLAAKRDPGPPALDDFHHGDCIGADAEAHALAMPNLWTVAHPCTPDAKRAYVDADEILDPLPPLERNRAIVDATEVLIAAPRTTTEERRSGTWATVRYAVKTLKPVLIIWPDGTTRYIEPGGTL